MKDNFIIKMLGIEDKHVELFDSGEKDNTLWFELHTRVKQQRCPSCNARTKRIHSYRMQSIQSRSNLNKKVILHLKKRRYRCKTCSKTFFERLAFIERYQRHTTMLTQEVMSLVSEMSFTSAGRLTGMTPHKVLRIFDRRELKPKLVLPEAIAIDEFKGDAGGEKFQTILVDVKEKRILDILPDRRVETIENYFRKCDTSQVKIVVIDLSKSFKQAIRKQLAQPVIIADRFHYMRQAYWAFDQVRRAVQHDLLKDHRIRMKRSRKLLLKSRRDLDDEAKEKVESFLALDPRLRKAYELKTAFDDWFKTSEEETVQENMHTLFEVVKQADCPEFRSVVGTFKRWKKEIIHSFIYPYNNGYIEGVNNTTKVIKRISYGIQNFERLRKKILWRQMVRKPAVV